MASIERPKQMYDLWHHASGTGVLNPENNGPMAQAITRDPEIMHGTPVFRGSRVPVQTLFDYLEGGDTLEDFLEAFPTVSRKIALQALEEAKHCFPARNAAGNRRIFMERMDEQRVEAGRRKQQEFVDLAELLRSATDPEEISRLGDPLGRMAFGG